MNRTFQCLPVHEREHRIQMLEEQVDEVDHDIDWRVKVLVITKRVTASFVRKRWYYIIESCQSKRTSIV